MNQGRFLSFTGIIEEIEKDSAQGCSDDTLKMRVVAASGSVMNVIVDSKTFVVDWITLEVGMDCTFWYDAALPALLIEPPIQRAVVALAENNNFRVDVSTYAATGKLPEDENVFANAAENEMETEFVNEENSLCIRIDDSVQILSENGQHFLGKLEGRGLVIKYQNSTRSIPARTTPAEIIVLNNLTNF